MPRIKLILPVQKTQWTKIPNYLLDTLLPNLKDSELRVILVILRGTVGFNRPEKQIVLTYKTLILKTGRRSDAISTAIKALNERGLIHSSIRKRL